MAALAVPGYLGRRMRIALFSALLAVGAAAPAPAHLQLVQASPVVVAGTGFAPGRSVTVGYRSGAQQARRTARADRSGRVRVAFKGVTFARCRGASIRAASAPALVVLPCTVPGGRPTVAATIAGLVRGSAFVPGEHVALTARISDADPVTAKLDAAADGSFSAQLRLPSSRCGELFVRASGSLGSVATFSFAGPACRNP